MMESGNLTDTFGVLKLFSCKGFYVCTAFNRYIWSIETKILLHIFQTLQKFNRYIWSIETSKLIIYAIINALFNRYIWSIETTMRQLKE